MHPLIEIKRVPIEIEMKVSHAKLEYTRGTADLEISRNPGGLSIRSKPIQLKIDTFEARNSVVPTTMQSIRQGAERGKQAVYEATAEYARQGQLLLTARIGEEMITKFAAEAQAKDIKTNVGLDFIPKAGAALDWQPSELNIRFEMDKVNFDWRLSQQHFEFTPGSIEISVTQQPEVIINYVGGPIYVPRSADPDYHPLNTQA